MSLKKILVILVIKFTALSIFAQSGGGTSGGGGTGNSAMIAQCILNEANLINNSYTLFNTAINKCKVGYVKATCIQHSSEILTNFELNYEIMKAILDSCKKYN